MSYSSEVLADSPLAYYRLGESSGTTILDSSGNGRSGTYAGDAAPPTLGVAGLLTSDSDTCADFTGSNFGEVAYGAWMNVSAVTLECLVNLDSTSGNPTLIDRDQGTGRLLQFRLDAGKIQWLFATTSAWPRVVNGATTLATGTTYHLAATYDGTTAKVYVNGTLDGSLSLTEALAGGNTPLAIGASRGGSGGYPGFQRVDGRMDEVAYYGTALSAERIAAHYAAATTSPAPTGALTAILPVPTVTLSGTYVPPSMPTGSLAATLPVPTLSLAGAYAAPANPTGSLDLTLPVPTFSLSGTYLGDAPVEIVRNGFGLALDSSATVNVEAPLDAGSLTSTVALHIIAAAVPVPTLVAGRPQ